MLHSARQSLTVACSMFMCGAVLRCVVCPFVCTAAAGVPSGFIVSGALDSNDCPPYYHRIPYENDCKNAAADMGLTYRSSENIADYPQGCYSFNTNVYLNKATAGSKNPTAKLLCSGARLSLAAVMESESERAKTRGRTRTRIARAHTHTCRAPGYSTVLQRTLEYSPALCGSPWSSGVRQYWRVLRVWDSRVQKWYRGYSWPIVLYY